MPEWACLRHRGDGKNDQLLIIVSSVVSIAGLCLDFQNGCGLKCFLLKEHFLYKDAHVFANKMKRRK